MSKEEDRSATGGVLGLLATMIQDALDQSETPLVFGLMIFERDKPENLGYIGNTGDDHAKVIGAIKLLLKKFENNEPAQVTVRVSRVAPGDVCPGCGEIHEPEEEVTKH